MRFISESQSAALITHDMAYESAREALAAICADTSVSFPVVLGHGSSSTNRFTAKAGTAGDVAGVKIGSYWPSNADRGLPRHNSLILLFDQEVGRITAAIEAGRVNAYRTAAADAVAADLLARPDSSVLTIFGAGHQAEFECLALSQVRTLSKICIVARDTPKAEAMAASLHQRGLSAHPMSAEEACRAADIIVTATASRAPLFDAAWVRPGTHLASMGSDATGKQELPPLLFDRARLFCDLPSQSRVIGEFQHAPKETLLTALGEVILRRHPGRQSRDDITIFDSSGLAIQDLYIGKRILDAAMRSTDLKLQPHDVP